MGEENYIYLCRGREFRAQVPASRSLCRGVRAFALCVTQSCLQERLSPLNHDHGFSNRLNFSINMTTILLAIGFLVWVVSTNVLFLWLGAKWVKIPNITF